MHRFFVPPTSIQRDWVRLTGPVVHQLTHVLRLSAGQRIVLLDGSGWEYTAELRRLEREQAEACIVERKVAQGEPHTQITLYQAVLKRERFEWVLQKGTELGIAAFVPLLCARNVVRDLGVMRKKRTRWETIVREAAEQAQRGRLPRLAAALPFAEACLQAQAAGGFSLLAWEGETATNLKTVLQAKPSNFQHPTSNFQLFIGPEGGFTAEEVALAQGHGILPVSLGRRILRAETAGLVAAAAIFYDLNDLG